jgi:P pilus assembly chaperone PapD
MITMLVLMTGVITLADANIAISNVMITMPAQKIVAAHHLDANMMKYPVMIKMLVQRTLVIEM